VHNINSYLQYWFNSLTGVVSGLQPGHYSSLTAPNLKPTANQERNDHCGNQYHSRELLMMGIVMPETCWGYKKYNKITSGIYFIFYSSLKIFHFVQTETRSFSIEIRVNLNGLYSHCFSLFIHRYDSLTRLWIVIVYKHLGEKRNDSLNNAVACYKYTPSKADKCIYDYRALGEL